MLKESLELLASDFRAQVHYLQTQGVPAGADELAENFADEALLVPQLLKRKMITPLAAAEIDKLEELLSSMSGGSNAPLWTTEALEQSHEWALVRKQARNALNELENAGSGSDA